MKIIYNYFNFYFLLIKLFYLIKNFKKKYLVALLFILALSAFLEICILGFLYILIKAFTNPDYYYGTFYFQFLIKLFNLTSNQELVLLISIFFITVCFLSGILRLFFIYISTLFLNYIGRAVGNLCYEKMIYQSFDFYFTNNTNAILSIFSTKLVFIFNSIFNTINMFYNFIIFFLTFLILSYINFYVSILSTAFFIILYILIIFAFKKKIISNGSIIANEQPLNLKIIRETFNGFRDILLNNNQKFYADIFSNSNNKLLKAQDKFKFIYSIPRPIIETFLLVSVGFVIAINSNNYESLEKLLPFLATIAVAAQRILPILNQLYTSHATNLDQTESLRFIITFLSKETISSDKKKIKPLEFSKSIALKNISFSYNSKTSLILEDINLNILAGSRIGIIGKSGSGKSTLADLILGIVNPIKGEILVDGKSIINKKQSWYSKVANVPQNIFITEQSIAENIAFGVEKNKIDLNKVKKVAKQAKISDFIESKSGGYWSFIGEKGLKISVGQRQRIAIARALYKKSSLIVFDEATSSLDTDVEKLILNTIFNLNRKNYTLIIISHKFHNLKRCDSIYKIENSKLKKL
jgi:ABC-type multidrug transport system fused ATPase/permease subunit